MVLYLVGLGLGDEQDITLRGLRAIQSCDRVFLEAYTSILGVDRARLEALYGCKIELADRDLVEQGADTIIEAAEKGNAALLVVGDPFGATTHSDFVIRAVKAKVRVEVIHNASILNAVGVSGLQLYRFGHAVSLCFWTDSWQPDSWYDRVIVNRKHGLHTLFLLDIKVKERSIEALMKGLNKFEPPRYMTISQAAQQLLQVMKKRIEKGETPAYDETTLCVGMARVGQRSQKIITGTLQELVDVDFGPPLHSLVMVGELHDMEKEHIALFQPKQKEEYALICPGAFADASEAEAAAKNAAVPSTKPEDVAAAAAALPSLPGLNNTKSIASADKPSSASADP